MKAHVTDATTVEEREVDVILDAGELPLVDVSNDGTTIIYPAPATGELEVRLSWPTLTAAIEWCGHVIEGLEPDAGPAVVDLPIAPHTPFVMGAEGGQVFALVGALRLSFPAAESALAFGRGLAHQAQLVLGVDPDLEPYGITVPSADQGGGER